MERGSISRRGFLAMLAAGGVSLGIFQRWRTRGRSEGAQEMLTVYTFGDSILDCGRYNPHGMHPGQLIVKNDDRLFPEFRGQDLSSRGHARLEHRAVDGARVGSLPGQGRGISKPGRSVA